MNTSKGTSGTAEKSSHTNIKCGEKLIRHVAVRQGVLNSDGRICAMVLISLPVRNLHMGDVFVSVREISAKQKNVAQSRLAISLVLKFQNF